MTALDDALDSSAPVYGPVRLYADWKEQPIVDTSADALRDLSNQVGPGGIKVSHSLDDGLPGPVTMTQGNDASGSLVGELLGRPEQYADVLTWRTSVTGGGVTDSPSIAFPSNVGLGDYCIVALCVNSSTVTLTDNDGQWELLGAFNDSPAALEIFIWGKHYAVGMTAPDVTLSASTATVWVSSAVSARTASGDIHVDFRPNETLANAESVSTTAHVAPSTTLSRRGYTVGVFATLSAAGPWAPVGGDVELADGIVSPLEVSMTTSSLRQPGAYVTQATTLTATATAIMASIALEVWDRPRMDAPELYSPFNSDSPFYGYERDTAAVQTDFSVLTENGLEDTTIYRGQMGDIAVHGRSAELESFSETRIALNRSLVLPVVWANRENCTVDWLATWLMARGGQFVGPAPNRYTRYWNSFYGSVHGHLEGTLSYSAGLLWNADGGPFGLKPPTVVDGPFLAGMYAHQQDLTTEEVRMVFRPSFEVLPYLDPPQPFHDQISQANSAGRLTVWLRGDTIDNSPTNPPSNNVLLRYVLQGLNVGVIPGHLEVGVNGNRNLYVAMGSLGGTTSFTSSLSVPADGEWHFVGFSWDWAAGTYRFKMDGSATSGGTLATTDTDLYETDADYWSRGGSILNWLICHVPVSDLMIDSGPETHTDTWSTFYPTPEAPGLTATMRPTFQTIEVIAEENPINAWDELANLAQASLSSYRTNEQDNLEFLPLHYFGEAAQMTSAVVYDTEKNAGELAVRSDPTKTRNVVTVKFLQKLGDSTTSTVMAISSAIEIPRGISVMTLFLDTPAAEIHGAAFPGSSFWDFTNLTSAQIATPSTIPTGVHYISANSKQDGSGTVIASTALGVMAKIIDVDSSTITVQFNNRTPAVAWLSNNGQQVPFMMVLGYAVRTTDGYVTIRDSGSIGTRRERALDVELPWVQNLRYARERAQDLAVMLSHPRHELSVTVSGDPRRKPGQLVTIADVDGTRVDGTWRVLSVGHNVNGPQYTQDLALVYVLPAGVWDGADGWDNAVWGE